ncbi:unnamed protein product [Vitrella brassicaformis CCMP3155]|uniref:Cwf18 pre-mRNA splicing factor n=1 Tax=Vitrella brassicaformis (strain CCMP3155) TaxID=1169540 RepID=A0A0G4EB22_VITBC|nr:unnamed protein product [Vitrella brassicaformis CCMP3155]|eukprot:CEL92884.1 unnamed protein product [Vitrella brassicaformis CCMP3155]
MADEEMNGHKAAEVNGQLETRDDNNEDMKDPDEDEQQDEDESARPIKFRNYIPRMPALRKGCMKRPVVDAIEKRIEEEIQEVIEAGQTEDALSRILPKKANWDLKRDVEKRLGQLKRKTDRAVLQIIRRKLQDDKTESMKELHQPVTGKGSNDNDYVEQQPEKLTRTQMETAHSVLAAAERFEALETDELSDEGE